MTTDKRTRRCVLVEDGGCGRLLPATAFRSFERSGRTCFEVKCADCRAAAHPPISTDEQARRAVARDLYESGAPYKVISEALGGPIRRAYDAATYYGWDRVARTEAQLAARNGSLCSVPGCTRPSKDGGERCGHHERARRRNVARRAREAGEWQCKHEGCYRTRTVDSDLCEGHARKLALPPMERAPRKVGLDPSITRATVTIRCHECGMYRQTTLAAPDDCPRCGTGGAEPFSEFEEAA